MKPTASTKSCRTISIAVVLLAATMHAVAAPPAALELYNGRIALLFDRTNGSLLQILDVPSSRSLLERTLPKHSLWQAHLSTPLTSNVIVLTPEKASRFTAERSGTSLVLRWDGFRAPLSGSTLVEVTVNLPEDSPDSYWKIRIAEGSGYAPSLVHFPVLPSLAGGPGERLAVPLWMGQESVNPRRLFNAGKGQTQEWSYPGHLSMQCLAVTYPKLPGIYFAGNDTAAYHKSFSCSGNGVDALQLRQTHYPETTTGSQVWEIPYDVIIGTLNGDWFAAAEHYRQWASQQEWARKSRLNSGRTAQWLNECDLWVWNRGQSSGVLKPAQLLSTLAGSSVGVFWHWWHKCAYDMGFPEYLPPREGAESFNAALGEAHKAGLHAIVYMNQRLWGMTTDSWKKQGAEQFAVKNPQGRVQPEIYNVFTSAPCASMCMGTQFWRDTYAGLAERACREHGVDGIYMDQACSSLACYDSTQGHPIGGGRYWMQGFQKMEADIRKRCDSSTAPVVLAGEGVAESWLPDLDVMLSLEVSHERYRGVGDWEVIPFFHAVYHADGLIYGNYSSLASPPYDDLWPREYAPEHPMALLDRKYSQQFALEQARSFVWGQQLTIANFLPEQLEQRREEVAQVVDLARIRKDARKYLRDGAMLRAPVVGLPETTIPISRLSIYAGRTPGAVRSYEKSVPQALAAAWKADDGHVAIAVASIVDRAIEVPLILSGCDWLPKIPCNLRRIDETDGPHIQSWKPGDNEVRVVLRPRQGCVIEFGAGNIN